MGIAEDVGSAVYYAAGLDPESPPDAGAVALATALHGPGVIYALPRAMSEASLAVIHGQRRIVLRKGLTAGKLNFRVAQMVLRMYLDESGLTASPDEALEIAAWLVAPTAVFRDAYETVGPRLDTLAAAFVITETCAAMRIYEIGGPSSIVATPTMVHRKGQLLQGLSDESVRELAAKSNPRSVRKVQIRDEPGRVALLARTSWPPPVLEHNSRTAPKLARADGAPRRATGNLRVVSSNLTCEPK